MLKIYKLVFGFFFSEKRLILGLEKIKKCGSEGAIFGANYNSIEMLKDSFCLLKD